MKKRKKAFLTGSIQTRHYDNEQGQRVYVTEVNVDQFYFLEPKGSQQQSYAQDSQVMNNQSLPF